MKAKEVGVPGFEARLTGGGGFLIPTGDGLLELSADGKGSLGGSARSFVGLVVVAKGVDSCVSCRRSLLGTGDASSNLGGDSGDCSVNVGGERGGDQGPIDRGRCLSAEPGASRRGTGWAAVFASEEGTSFLDPLAASHCGLLGISSDDLPLSCSTTRACAGVALRGGTTEDCAPAMLSNRARSDDTGFCRELVMVEKGWGDLLWKMHQAHLRILDPCLKPGKLVSSGTGGNVRPSIRKFK